MNSPSPIVRFYASGGTDHRGRTLSEILSWDDDRLERTHDAIQWLFPLAEASAFNAAAPRLTDDDIHRLRADAAARANLIASFRRMLAFYGLALQADATPPLVEPGANFTERAGQWLTPGNHNFLRLTRIMRCLDLIGLTEQARALQKFLLNETEREIVGEATRRYWRGAIGD